MVQQLCTHHILHRGVAALPAQPILIPVSIVVFSLGGLVRKVFVPTMASFAVDPVLGIQHLCSQTKSICRGEGRMPDRWRELSTSRPGSPPISGTVNANIAATGVTAASASGSRRRFWERGHYRHPC